MILEYILPRRAGFDEESLLKGEHARFGIPIAENDVYTFWNKSYMREHFNLLVITKFARI